MCVVTYAHKRSLRTHGIGCLRNSDKHLVEYFIGTGRDDEMITQKMNNLKSNHAYFMMNRHSVKILKASRSQQYSCNKQKNKVQIH